MQSSSETPLREGHCAAMSSAGSGTAPANRGGAGETTKGTRLEEELNDASDANTPERERNAEEPLDTEFDERVPHLDAPVTKGSHSIASGIDF